jgi:homoserine kinase type II
MAHYSRLSDSQLHRASALFGVRLAEATFIDGGLAKTNYRLVDDTGKVFVLTVADSERNLPAGVTAQLLRYVAEHGIPTSEPVTSVAGNFLEPIDDHCVLLKRYVSGSISHVLPFELLTKAGAQLAAIHRIPVPQWLPSGTRRMDDAEASVAQFEDIEFAGWVLQQLAETRSVFDSDQSPCVNHGDYFADNLVVMESGELAVIDWDTASRELPVIDLGFAIVGLACVTGSLDALRLRELLGGYERTRQLSPKEVSSLQHAAVYAATVLAHHRYRRFHVLFPQPDKFDAHQELQHIVRSLRSDWPL